MLKRRSSSGIFNRKKKKDGDSSTEASQRESDTASPATEEPLAPAPPRAAPPPPALPVPAPPPAAPPPAAAPPARALPPPPEAAPPAPAVSEMPAIQMQTTMAMDDGYTFVRVTVHRVEGRLGIGLDNDLCVTELVPGGPGFEAGVQVDDQLVEVNGHSTWPRSDDGLRGLMPKDESAPLVFGLRRPPAAMVTSTETTPANTVLQDAYTLRP